MLGGVKKKKKKKEKKMRLRGENISFFSAPTLRVKYEFLICMNFWSFAWMGSV